MIEKKDSACPLQKRRSMGNDYPGDWKIGDEFSDCFLRPDVEVCGSLVEDQNFWHSIEGAGKDYALLLPTRKCRAHIADQ